MSSKCPTSFRPILIIVSVFEGISCFCGFARRKHSTSFHHHFSVDGFQLFESTHVPRPTSAPVELDAVGKAHNRFLQNIKIWRALRRAWSMAYIYSWAPFKHVVQLLWQPRKEYNIEKYLQRSSIVMNTKLGRQRLQRSSTVKIIPSSWKFPEQDKDEIRVGSR